jgi:hypothetical protein
MGLILRFRGKPTPRGLDIANNGLATAVDMDVFDRDFLLSLATMAVQCLQPRAGQPRQRYAGDVRSQSYKRTCGASIRLFILVRLGMSTLHFGARCDMR